MTSRSESPVIDGGRLKVSRPWFVETRAPHLLGDCDHRAAHAPLDTNMAWATTTGTVDERQPDAAFNPCLLARIAEVSAYRTSLRRRNEA